MIPADEVTALRAAIGELLPDTCTVLSPTETSDGQGGVVTTWGTANAALACRMDKMNGSEGIVGAARQPFAGYMLSVPQSATILPTYRVLFNGNTYAVVSGNSDQSDMLVQRVQVELV